MATIVRLTLSARVAPLFLLAAVVLVPWTGYLVATLPATHQAQHWDVVWVGFDLLLATALGSVGLTIARRSAWLEGAATAAAALLFVDAWFDVLTARTTAELAVAVAEAVVVELPLACVCLILARSAQRAIVEGRPRRSLITFRLPASD